MEWLWKVRVDNTNPFCTLEWFLSNYGIGMYQGGYAPFFCKNLFPRGTGILCKNQLEGDLELR